VLVGREEVMISAEFLKCYARLFVGRRNDYAIQQEDGRYLRAGRPLTYSLLEEHLQSVQTLGTYVIDEQGTCRFAVLDADTPDGVTVLAGVQERLHQDGIPSYLEGSRRGCHLWVFCDRLVNASHLRRWLLPSCPAWKVEFYPKQNESQDGYGSLIRLPLGVHRLSGHRYNFFTWQPDDVPRRVPVAPRLEDTLAWLSSIQRATVPGEDTLPSLPKPWGQASHPSLAKTPGSVTASPTGTIQDWCASQDPLMVIGRYVQLDQHGLGCCPFGGHHSDGVDSHPSFRVYQPRRPGGSCWYCYAWGKGGTLFDFLMLYHRLDARTLWRRILAGEAF
jgi:hypothetical protein